MEIVKNIIGCIRDMEIQFESQTYRFDNTEDKPQKISPENR